MNRGALTVWLSCLCAVLTGCGYMGEPLYPTANIPSPVQDLNAVQRGTKILVAFTIPPLTTDGLVLKQVGAIELRAGAASTTEGFDTEAWAAGANPYAVASPGEPGVVRGEIPVANLVGRDVIVGVRVANLKGRYSSWSNLATVKVVRPLDEPAELTAELTRQGVALRWKAGNGASWRVFRQAGGEKAASLLAKTGQPEYLDEAIAFGATYRYFVQAEQGTAESELAGPVSIQPQKKFPPAAPTGLTAVTGTNTIELSWDRTTETDFKEYRVYRAEGDGAFEMIGTGLAIPSYSDAKTQAGRRYRYAVAAVDQEGNVSERSQPVEATGP